MLWSIFPPFLNRTRSWNTTLGFPVAGRQLTTMNSQWFADIILADGWQLSWLTLAFHVCQVLLDIPIFTSPWISTTLSIIKLLHRMFLNPWKIAAYTQKVFLRTASYGKVILPFWAHTFTICAVLCSETCLRSSFKWLLRTLVSLSSSHSQKKQHLSHPGWVFSTFLPFSVQLCLTHQWGA